MWDCCVGVCGDGAGRGEAVRQGAAVLWVVCGCLWVALVKFAYLFVMVARVFGFNFAVNCVSFVFIFVACWYIYI